MQIAAIELNDSQFSDICELIYRNSGIHLKAGKESLVRSRLMRRLRAVGTQSVDAYLDYVKSDQGANELFHLIDVMTTNQTGFFRENAHFDFLRNQILPSLNSRRLRFWSAACSSGEEPYTLAILLRETIAEIDAKDVCVLATDISHRMLEIAKRGVYTRDRLRTVPPHHLKTYFDAVQPADRSAYRIKDCVRRLVKLAWLNLSAAWPMKGPFDVIFCRNVMIYFDRPTRQRLVNRFWRLLRPGGVLFVGHSEGLSAINHKFHFVCPATYRR
jgi:chemotaxis protein methyltransferase CheR